MQMEIEFDWHPAKAANNIIKHDIAFEDAITVFEDLKSLDADVTKLEYGEDRYLTIGMMADGR